MEDICFFECTNDSPNLISCGASRIETIKNSSVKRGDGLAHRLDGLHSIRCHKNCVSTYTSAHHIKRYLSKQEKDTSGNDVQVPLKKSRRSDKHDFRFKEQCLFCGEICLPFASSSRHPDRWRKVVQCRTAGGFKQNILRTCDLRNDALADDVRVRLSGALSDLHAADGQYHLDCYKLFMNDRNVQAASKSTISSQLSSEDAAFGAVVEEMSANKSYMWNSIEIENLYTSHGGTILVRYKLIHKLQVHFGGNLLVLSGNGVASILVFRSHAPSHLKLVDDHDDINVTSLAKAIKKECSEKSIDQDKYRTRLSLDDATEACSDLLLKLLAELSPKLDHSNAALLIGNIITSVLTNKPTTLQITIGTVLRQKSLIEQLSEFGITCSYDEVLRFKKSVAHAASTEKHLQGLMDSKVGLVQAVADNFDANIASPNGLKATHSLALLLTQIQDDDSQMEDLSEVSPTVRRLRKDELKKEPTLPVAVHHYHGPMKPAMPEASCLHQVLPLHVLAAKVISVNRAQEADYMFLRRITEDESTPEYNGFNTAMARAQGHTTRPATKAIYTPLIDMKPSDPDTIMTAMVEARRMTRGTNQSVTLFTLDQQLYRVAVDVLWAYPEQFQNVIPRLGGMHMLMSFIGAVGTLMSNSGLEELLNSAFAGVHKMLSGKKFPQNLRALRMVVEELLRDVILTCENFSDLLSELETRASQSRTSRVWVYNLIKPVLIMMQFVRAEREADWPLHLAAVAAMLPYFFASGHFNYARYGMYYLRSMEALPDAVLSEFMKGNHVMRHNPGLWNGVWSDMFIESTFMRFGHEAGGLIGLTLQPSSVSTWALSLHVCSQLRVDLTSMKDGQRHKVMTMHKEESKSRIKSDNADREKLKSTLATFIDPFDSTSHADGVVNIANGLVSPNSVNVDNSLEIGHQQMTEFEAGWPDSFHRSLKKNVITMPAIKKSIQIDGTPIYNTELIYTRVIGLQQSRDLNIKDVLKYELSSVPPALFDENGDMRSQAKATLKTKLQVEVSNRLTSPPDAIIIDGCALLWCVHWPASGNVEDYIKNFMQSLNYYLQKCCVHLIFDRYIETSTKYATRSNRAGKNASRKHVLTLATPLPTQKVILNVTHNKTQLIRLITQYLVDHLANNECNLVITSEQATPVAIGNGEVITRNDLHTTHEEADVIIVNQLVDLAVRGASNICVVCDDTDVFVLLIYFYCREKLDCGVTMMSPVAGRCVIDIKATANKHRNIADCLPGVHALSGCDTTSYIYGIGKARVLKVLNSGKALKLLGAEDVHIDEVVAEATSFISTCYGIKHAGDMSEIRYSVWLMKMANTKISSAPKLRSLPPTSRAFQEHVRRAHYQTMIWKYSLSSSPPTVADPVRYGWSKNEDNKLFPVMLPDGDSLVPVDVLQMIKCGCASSRPCATGRCSCVGSQMACSVFCICNAGPECNNAHTHAKSSLDNNDDEV